MVKEPADLQSLFEPSTSDEEDALEKSTIPFYTYDFSGEDWREVFIANYKGETEEAKELKDKVKQNYNGSSYVPWATMERLVYMQDPLAHFEKVKAPDGSLVFSRYDDITTYQSNRAQKEGEETGTFKEIQTQAQAVAHFVRVRLTFMGKTFEEDYPVQDNSYKPVKVFDANAINKSLQRAMAKVASRGTGLGLQLYENGDLQYEEE